VPLEAIARILPLAGSIATIAELGPAGSPQYALIASRATSCIFGLIVVWIRSPPRRTTPTP
jgi:hypothetical protein